MEHFNWKRVAVLYDFSTDAALYVEVCIQQIDSMLPCVCSVIDHILRQNVVRTKKWHMRRSFGLGQRGWELGCSLTIVAMIVSCSKEGSIEGSIEREHQITCDIVI